MAGGRPIGREPFGHGTAGRRAREKRGPHPPSTREMPS